MGKRHRFFQPASLDHNMISSTTSKRQSGAPSPMITIAWK